VKVTRFIVLIDYHHMHQRHGAGTPDYVQQHVSIDILPLYYLWCRWFGCMNSALSYFEWSPRTVHSNCAWSPLV
jgi:hypothetical protein